MKTIILAGGAGTRLSEETVARPKPMVTVGGRPLLWHLMKYYAHYGHTDFVLCLGHHADVAKEYVLQLHALSTSFTVDLGSGVITDLDGHDREPWTITALDTGLETQTGGRIRRALQLINDDTVLVTYGDGLADVNLDALLHHHRSHGRLVTVTAVRPPARFGRLEVGDDDVVRRFGEKVQEQEGWINGGFFVMQREVLDYLDGDEQPLERAPLERLAAAGELRAFRHTGYWQPMDTVRDRQQLESHWSAGTAPWRVWR